MARAAARGHPAVAVLGEVVLVAAKGAAMGPSVEAVAMAAVVPVEVAEVRRAAAVAVAGM